MIRAVEEYFGGQGFNNINLCTNGFQASGFYEKCGFELEFVRENKTDPRLNKYFYITHYFKTTASVMLYKRMADPSSIITTSSFMSTL